MDYELFLREFDLRIQTYFKEHKDFICCKPGCSSCCEKGDYPVSEIELQYMMQGYLNLDNTRKVTVQENIKNMKRGDVCPFLIEKKCSIYKFRPIICRVHGIAYLCKEKTVKVPYCVNEGKNYKGVYNNGEIYINPVKENLDTPNVLQGYYQDLYPTIKETENISHSIVIKNLYDWLKNSQ